MLAVIMEIALAPATQAEAVDFTWLFIKMIVALVVVCITAVVVLKYAIPKLSFAQKYSNNKYISVVARHSLDHRKNLYIVKVGQKYALVGSTEHGLNLVMELKKEDVE